MFLDGTNDIAKAILSERYLQKDDNGNIVETEAEMYRRVAKYVANGDSKYEEIFYELMCNKVFMPNTPCLINAGVTNRPQQLSACFVLNVDDSLQSILQTAMDAAIIHSSGGGCIAKGSKVLTSNGPQNIEDIIIGDQVLSMDNKTGEQTYKLVQQTHIYDAKDKNILKISFGSKHNNVITTDWHPFAVLTSDGIVYKRADELKINDAIISGTRVTSIVKNDYAWALGVIISDGSIGLQSDKTNYRVRVNKSHENVIINVAKVFNIKYTQCSNKRYSIPVFEAAFCGKQAKDIYDMLIGDNKLIGALNKKVPDYIFNSDKSTKLSFIAGLLDGDGNYNISKNEYEYYTVSKKLFEGISALLSELGISFRWRLKKTNRPNENDIYNIMINNSHNIYKYLIPLTIRYTPTQKQDYYRNAIELNKKYFKTWGFPIDARTKPFIWNSDRYTVSSWYNTGNITVNTLLRILDNGGIVDDITQLYANLIGGCQLVKSIERSTCEVLYDLTVEDNNNYMASTSGQMVIIHNTGYSFSALRPSGDIINSTKATTPGPIPFIKMYDAITGVITQGGVRRGANMGVLRVDHPDIEQFIYMKIDGTVTNFNISVGITEKFMNAVKEGEKFALINPRTGEVTRTVWARELFQKIAECAWKNGDPGILFLDRINKLNPLNAYEKIEACNPCLSGDNWVETNTGQRLIKDLVGVQTKLLLHGRPFETTKEGFFSTGKQQVFKLRTYDFEIKATANHQFFSNGVKKELKDFKINDFIDVDAGPSVQVTEIIPMGEEEVYNVTVPGPHKYNCCGFIVSNCGEQPLPSYGACILGHINLVKFFQMSEGERYRTVEAAVRFLDNSIDVGEFPLPQITDYVKRARKIGLGVMGAADVLMMNKLAYNSEEGRKLIGDLINDISMFAKDASRQLAKEKGGNCFLPDVRNGALMSIAPTGTVSTICNVNYGIEPFYSLAYTRTILDGTKFIEKVNCLPLTDEESAIIAKNHGKLTDELKEKYPYAVVSHDISFVDHIKMQAVVQEHVDGAISKTVNMSNDATVMDVLNAYKLADELGCKGITIFRDGCRDEQVFS